MAQLQTYPVTLDTVSFDHKPTNDDTKYITLRMQRAGHVEVTAEELGNAVRTGVTHCCGCFKPSPNGWGEFVCARLASLDFDNMRTVKRGKKKVSVPLKHCEFGWISPTMAIYRCMSMLGMVPVVVYETFSSTEKHPKFRIIIDLAPLVGGDGIIRDESQALETFSRLRKIYPEADNKTEHKNRYNRLMYGTGGNNAEYWRDISGWEHDLEGVE